MTQRRCVTVTLVYTPARGFWRKDTRWQPWRWRAQAANGRVLAVSSESYTNRADCLAAVALVFGDQTDVELVEDGIVPCWLRRAATS